MPPKQNTIGRHVSRMRSHTGIRDDDEIMKFGRSCRAVGSQHRKEWEVRALSNNRKRWDDSNTEKNLSSSLFLTSKRILKVPGNNLVSSEIQIIKFGRKVPCYCLHLFCFFLLIENINNNKDGGTHPGGEWWALWWYRWALLLLRMCCCVELRHFFCVASKACRPVLSPQPFYK